MVIKAGGEGIIISFAIVVIVYLLKWLDIANYIILDHLAHIGYHLS